MFVLSAIASASPTANPITIGRFEAMVSTASARDIVRRSRPSATEMMSPLCTRPERSAVPGPDLTGYRQAGTGTNDGGGGERRVSTRRERYSHAP